ncbi:hypothetical protein K523DRAFT_123898 [Schizophyllum commune Tattone D]|nr:hypothetical protein K523DRAFT_123898 [Schizophyllum commune Tattone D]
MPHTAAPARRRFPGSGGTSSAVSRLRTAEVCWGSIVQSSRLRHRAYQVIARRRAHDGGFAFHAFRALHGQTVCQRLRGLSWSSAGHVPQARKAQSRGPALLPLLHQEADLCMYI